MEHEQMNQDNVPAMPQIFLSSSANIQPMQVFMAPGSDSSGQSSVSMTVNNEVKAEESPAEKGDNPNSLCGKELKQKINKGEGLIASSGKSDTHQGASSIEGLGAGVGADLNLKPSLLEEVLADKKSALMRSPDVIQFLQQQQAKLQAKNKDVFDIKYEKS